MPRSGPAVTTIAVAVTSGSVRAEPESAPAGAAAPPGRSGGGALITTRVAAGAGDHGGPEQIVAQHQDHDDHEDPQRQDEAQTEGDQGQFAHAALTS